MDPNHAHRARALLGALVPLSIAALAALILCGPAAAAGYPSCSWSPSSVVVTGGQSVTVTISCVGDPGDHYTARVTEAPTGVAGAITPGAAPNTFALTLTAPADARENYLRVGIVVEGGAYPVDVSIPVAVQRVPTPDCSVESAVTTPAGLARDIYVRCETSGREGEDSTFEIVEQPKHGRLSAGRYDRGWTYTPERGFLGTDRVTFRAKNAFGTSPVMVVDIRVRKPTRYERDAEYVGRVCASVPRQTSCRAGRGRTTAGGTGTGKVSHRNWPAITGVYLTFPGGGGGKLVGGELTDELLGHHGSDTIFGGDGKDIIWGDWDPENNNSTQRDSLNGEGGTDFIYTSHGRNRVTGGAGNDFIWAFYGHGTIDCGPGIDKVRLSGRKSAYKLRSCERRGTF